MTMHCFGMATHQQFSRTALVGYSTVSHDNHVQATWHESDWCDRIQKFQAPESAQCVPAPFLLLGVGSGTRLVDLADDVNEKDCQNLTFCDIGRRHNNLNCHVEW